MLRVEKVSLEDRSPECLGTKEGKEIYKKLKQYEKTVYTERYRELIDYKIKCRTSRKPLVFRTNWTPRKNVTGLHERFAPRTLPLTCQIETDFGIENWMYAIGGFKESRNGVEYPVTNRDKDGIWGAQLMLTTSTIVLDPIRQVELAFYLEKILPNVSLLKQALKIEDLESDARDRYDDIQKTINLRSALYGDLAIYKEDSIDDLKIAATAWGVKDVQIKEYYELIGNLETAVLDSEADRGNTRRGVQEFLEEVKFDKESMKRRALLNKALADNIITFDALGGFHRFSDNKRTKIVKLNVVELNNVSQSLFEYFEKNNDLYKDLYALLGHTEDIKSDDEITSNEIDTMKRPALIELGKQLCPDKALSKTKDADIKEILKEHLKK